MEAETGPRRAARRLLVAALFGALLVVPQAALAGPPPAVPAAAWALIDEYDGLVLAERNGDERRAMASITKLMTAKVARDEAPRGSIVVTPAAAGVGEASAGLVAGQRIGVERLLALALVPSGNDAAVALAVGIAGSEAAFTERMNATARRLGLRDTRYVNAHGLDAEGHYSTARDSARLGVEIRRDPVLRRIVGEREVRAPSGRLPTTNLLLGDYPGADGIKTGMTGRAGWSLVASAEQDGRRLTVAVLGADSEEDRLLAARRLLDWGFAQFHTTPILAAEVPVAWVPTATGSRLALQPAETADVTLRGAETPTVRLVVPDRVATPLPLGAPLGYAEVLIGSRVQRTVPLVAATAYAAPEPRRRILRLLEQLPFP